MICQVFKPERTHHCSTCKRCVLVMDHHCPWLSNCVGFKNRKTFMLLIIYAFTYGVLGLLGSIYPLILLGGELPENRYGRLHKFVIGIIGNLLGIAFVITMINFLRYHFYLVNNNKTTIENLDEKRGNVGGSYDMGKDYNWKMIFGKNKALWFLPITTGDGAPLGDGVVINKVESSFSRVKSQNMDDDEDENSIANPSSSNPYTDPLNARYDRIAKQTNPLNKDICKSYIRTHTTHLVLLIKTNNCKKSNHQIPTTTTKNTNR